MFCLKCGAPNEDSAEYCGNCGAALQAGGQPAGEPSAPVEVVAEVAAEPETAEVAAEAPSAAVAEEDLVVVPSGIEPVRAAGAEQRIPEPVVAARKYNPDTAFLIEFLAGIFGLLGIGYMYAGRTNDGVVRLVVWLIYTVLAWVVVGLLSTILVGLICIPFQLVLQVGVPLWSANALKRQLLAEG